MQTEGNEVKILAVDDSPVSSKLVEMALSRKNYKLIFAKSGRHALVLFAEHRPALVIIDWMMPDLSGEELCQHIRSMFADAPTYIIVLTGKADKDNVIRALQVGADDYVTKPFHQGELVARVGAGLRIAQMHRKLIDKNILLEEQALTDPLTGLPNRRAIDSWGATQLSSATRHGYSFWVVLADLDHFKQVNDTFGHEAGDVVLKKFAKILRTCARQGDVCGRVGGEEFLLILTHTNSTNALAVIERIRAELADTSFTFGGCTIAVTASFGLAGFEGTERPSTFNRLRALADAALYAAKRRGRNRIEVSAASAY